MGNFERFEQYEYDFIKEAFFNDWPVSVIAEKLERHTSTIFYAIAWLNLNRPNYDIKTPKLDWPSIWFAYRSTNSVKAAAGSLGLKRQGVSYAVRQMIFMTAEERLVKWNKYALKHGREPYTLADARADQ